MLPTQLNSRVEHDFSRTVVCLMGMPIDVGDLESAAIKLREAASKQIPTFLSTPNLNFLISARNNTGFRTSLIQSNLITLDGMPLLWIAKLLGVQSISKVSGSSLFDYLQNEQVSSPISVFFFGGECDAAKHAHQNINAEKFGVKSSGYLNPGFGNLDQLSTNTIVESINAAESQFIVVALGAEKGQQWILKNKDKLNAPILAHLGAVINFTSGRIKRAPRILQACGLEWLWRIKEEPRLFSRYLIDGVLFLKLLFSTILPYAVLKKLHSNKVQASSRIGQCYFEKITSKDKKVHTLTISGYMTKENLTLLNSKLSSCASYNRVNLDLEQVEYIDEFGLGQLLVLEKHLNGKLKIIAASKYISKVFRFENLEHLIA